MCHRCVSESQCFIFPPSPLPIHSWGSIMGLHSNPPFYIMLNHFPQSLASAHHVWISSPPSVFHNVSDAVTRGSWGRMVKQCPNHSLLWQKKYGSWHSSGVWQPSSLVWVEYGTEKALDWQADIGSCEGLKMAFRAEKTFQWLRVLTALSEELGSVPKTHIDRVFHACNSSSGVSVCPYSQLTPEYLWCT